MMLCTVSLGYTSQAQTTKGTVAFTGSLGYTQSKGKSDYKSDVILFEGFEPHRIEHSSLTLSPSIGYFIKDNLEVGISVFSSHSESKSIHHSGMYENGTVTLERQYNTLNNTKHIGLNVYARQYKFLTEKLAIYGTLSVGYNKANLTSIYTLTDTASQVFENDNLYSTYAAALSPGVTFFVSRKIGLNANLGALTYNRYKREEIAAYRSSGQPQPSVRENPSYTSNSLSLDFSSMHLNFGLSYYLGK